MTSGIFAIIICGKLLEKTVCVNEDKQVGLVDSRLFRIESYIILTILKTVEIKEHQGHGDRCET